MLHAGSSYSFSRDSLTVRIPGQTNWLVVGGAEPTVTDPGESGLGGKLDDRIRRTRGRFLAFHSISAAARPRS